MLGVAAKRESRRRVACRELEQLAVRGSLEVSRGGGRARAFAWEYRIAAVCPGDVGIEVGVARDRPAPLRLGGAVEHDSGVGAVRVGVAGERLEQARVEPDKRAA